MTVIAFRRGNRVTFDHGLWRYDDGTEADHDRPCPKCGEMPTPEGYDACVEFVPGAISVCCGHGVDASYVVTRHAYTCARTITGNRCNCGMEQSTDG